MADTPIPPPPDWVPSDRYHVQMALSQIHGVLHRAVLDAGFWLPRSNDNEPGAVALTADDLDAAYLEACRQVGTIQAALNTGAFDRPLANAGFSGAQLKAKLKGLWQAIRRYGNTAKNSVTIYLGRMLPTLGWCGSILGSITSALQKEIDKVPGASAAAEGLKEFIELLQNAAELAMGGDSPTAASNGPAKEKRGERKIDLDE